MAVTLRDNCDRSYMGFGIPEYSTKIGQTITPGETYKLERIDFYTTWDSASPGTCYVAVYETDGGYPTGSPITDTAAFTVTGTKTLESIIFSTQPTLQSGTKYAIVWTAPNGDPGVTGLNVFGEHITGSYYAGGDRIYYGWPDPQWYTITTQDIGFYCYGSDPVPEKPTNPTPADEESGISLNATTVTWEDGGGADTYNVYFGTLSGFLSLVAEGISDLEAVLVTGNFTNYGFPQYWRVDAINDAGTTQGDEWYLTTLVYDPVLPTGINLVDGEPTGDPTGENNMMTVKRLVVAANSKIWYEEI